MKSRRTLAATLLAASACAGATLVDVPEPAHAGSTTTAADRRVLLVSIDGLNPQALRRLGQAGTPVLHRLVAEGASTMNARTEVEQTETLPNHVGMVSGRRIDRRRGGHGVTWNDERLRPRTVHRAAGHRVASIFSLANSRGLSGALFAAKPKFRLMTRSWPTGIDRTLIDARNGRLALKARRDLAARRHDVTMVHLSLPDLAGHRDGFMSPSYLQAVRAVDRLLGRVLVPVRRDVARGGTTWVVLTSDHGGGGRKHSHRDADVLADYRVPFVVWGPGVAAGGDLYALSPGLADPGRGRPGYAGRQPVRNAAAANVMAELLGLPPVPGSQVNRDRALNWK